MVGIKDPVDLLSVSHSQIKKKKNFSILLENSRFPLAKEVKNKSSNN